MKLLLIAVVGLFMVGQAGRGLRLPDEPRDAEIAREMSVSGDVVVPTLNGEPFLEKPPLSYAAAALALKLWPGRPETAVRIPSALFCLGAIGLTAWMGGLTAACILGTSWTFLDIGHTCLVDAGLFCWIALAMAAGRHRNWLLSGFAMALAFLSKGPIGVILPGAALGTWMLWERRGEIPKALPWILAGLLPVGIWLWALHQRPEAWTAYWGDQIRRSGSRVEHAAPFYAYLGYLVTDFAPWTLLIPVLVWRLVKDGMANVRFALAWFLSSLILLSLVTSKRGLYLVPAFPALALLAAPRMEGIWGRRALTAVALGGILVWGIAMPRSSAKTDVGALVREVGGESLAGMDLSEPVRGAAAFERKQVIPALKNLEALDDWISTSPGRMALVQGVLERTPEALEARLRKEPALAGGFKVLKAVKIKHEVLVWISRK